MKVVIIEDEKLAARRLERMLTKQDLQVEVLLHSVNQSVSWFLKNEEPDLIFLDVQLSDGLSFEIFEEVNLKSAIIFTTAYDEYAIKAFKLNSIDYLLKPIDEEELKNALEKYNESFSVSQKMTNDFLNLKAFLNESESQKNYKKRFVTKVGEHLKMFSVTEIVCFYSENKGTYLKTLENRNYLLDTSLEQLENELNPDLFFRVSRQFFVNINYIEDILAHSNSRLQIQLKNNKQKIIVSRERVKAFKTWLAN